MRIGYLGVVVAFCVTLAAAQKTETTSPKLSAEPLTAEQISVYSAVLEDYLKYHPNATLSLANVTEPLHSTGHLSAWSCADGLDLEVVREPASHNIDPEAVRNLRVTLVDPDIQSKRIADGFRQYLAHCFGRGRNSMTDAEHAVACKKAPEDNLFTLSEIAFDKQHCRAVVAYSYLCGGSCGHGGPLLLEKVDGTWMVRQMCAMWVI